MRSGIREASAAGRDCVVKYHPRERDDFLQVSTLGARTLPASLTDSVSFAGSHVDDYRVAIDDVGNVIVIWSQSDGTASRLPLVIPAPGTAPSVPYTVPQPAPELVPLGEFAAPDSRHDAAPRGVPLGVAAVLLGVVLLAFTRMWRRAL